MIKSNVSFAQEKAGAVTADTRRTSARTKVKLLAHGVRDAPNLFSALTSFKEEHYAYDNGNWGVDAGRRVPSEILLPGGITSKIHIRPTSELELRCDEDRLWVVERGDVLSEAFVLSRPAFWQHCTRAGVPTKQLAHFYGATCLNFNIYSGCQFYAVGTPCKFCSVQPTQKMHHAVRIHKSPEDLADVCELAVRHDRVEWFLMTGGSYLNGDRELDAHMTVLRSVRHRLPWGGRLRGNVALMPPRDLGRIGELHEVGVDHPSYNLEAWPRSAFERICPGKAEHVGFDHILRAYDATVRLYGPGRAWCNFVAGLVPLEDQKRGFTAMAEMGVVPGANVYHPEVNAPFGDEIPSPSEEYIVELYQHAANLYHRHGYRPFFDSAVLRNSLANEAYEGLL